MQQTIEANPTPENPKHKIWGVVLKVMVETRVDLFTFKSNSFRSIMNKFKL